MRPGRPWQHADVERSRSPQALLAGLLLAVSLHAFHAMAVVTVIPAVAEALDGRALYGAFFSSYLLASLLGLVWAGRALTTLGAQRTLGLCLAVFAAGVVASALAPSMPWLIAARLLEGFGGGGVSSILYAVVSLAYAEDERPRVLAWMSGAWVLPGLLGPPVAGLLAETFGWRSVFASVLPAVGLAAALALPALGRLAARAERDATAPRMGDALVLSVSVGAVLFALAQGPSWAAGALALLALSGLVFSARRVLPRGTMIAATGLPAAIATKFLANFAFFGAEAFVPLMLRDLRGWSLVEAGTVLTASALTWTAGAFVYARLAPQTSPRKLAIPGVLAIGAGVAGLAFMIEGPVPPGFAHAVWGLAGFGMGVAFTASTNAAMEATPPGGEGATSAALGIADSLGFALAAGVGGAVLALAEPGEPGTARALARVDLLMVACALLAAFAAFRLGGRSAAVAAPNPAPGVGSP